MAKVLYFTAGNVPTAPEIAAIAALEAIPRYDIEIRNGAFSASYGERPEDCDYVAGTVPSDFEEIDILDPDNLPGAGEGLPAGSVAIADQDELTFKDSTGANKGTVTVNITAGVLQNVMAHGTQAIIDDLQEITYAGNKYAFRVTAGVVSEITVTPV